MNVAELIQKLGEFPPELPVWHDGGDDPYMAGEIQAVWVEPIQVDRTYLGGERPDTYVCVGWSGPD